MKKILFLTPQLPYPPISGGTIKTYKMIEFLSKKYEITLACLLKNDDEKKLEEYQHISGLKNIISEPLQVERNAGNLVRSNLKMIPLNLFRNLSERFRIKLEGEWDQHDILLVDHYVMFQYVPENIKAKVILHQHNCEYLIWDRYAAIEKNILKKIALWNQSWHIKRYEQKICRRADTILAAPNDIEELVSIGAERSKFYTTYHLGDDSLLSLPDLHYSNSEKSLLYVGTLSWEANINGLLWFYSSAWPLIKAKHPDLKFYIVGKNPDDRITAFAEKDPQIILTGYVEDLEPYFQRSRAFISPLLFGSGIKVKVISSLYRGIPCVTTSIGAEGLYLKDGKELFIRDNASGFADAIHILLTDPVKWESMSVMARSTAKEKLSWDSVYKNLEAAMEGVSG